MAVYFPSTCTLAASTDCAPVTPDSRWIALRVLAGSDEEATTIMSAWSSPCSGATVTVLRAGPAATGSENEVSREVPRSGTSARAPVAARAAAARWLAG